jgi:hypothetical protein
MTREPFRPIVIDLPVKFIALLDKTAQDLGTTRHKLINKMLKRDYDYIIRFEANWMRGSGAGTSTPVRPTKPHRPAVGFRPVGRKS